MNRSREGHPPRGKPANQGDTTIKMRIQIVKLKQVEEEGLGGVRVIQTGGMMV